MAPKRKPAAAAKSDPDGIFRGVSAFIVPHGVQARRLVVALFPHPPLVGASSRYCALRHLGMVDAGVEAEAGADGGPSRGEAHEG
jgi:hypothetical protein